MSKVVVITARLSVWMMAESTLRLVSWQVACRRLLPRILCGVR